MKILGLDTSSQYGSLALCDTDTLVAEYTTLGRINQSEHCLGILQRVLADAGWSVDMLDGFAVVNGPGSFTGIRVGLATIQGLALATGRPALGISSLKALALGVPNVDTLICPVLDARKEEIYTALYRRKGDDLLEVVPEQVIAPAAFAAQMQDPILLIGDGAHVLDQELTRLGMIQVYRADGSANLLRASTIALWAGRELSVRNPANLPALRPHYLRNTAADLRLRKPTISNLFQDIPKSSQPS